MQTLPAIRKHFVDQLVRKDLRDVFYLLKQNIHIDSPVYDDLNLLQGQYTRAGYDQHVKGILSHEEARTIYNRIHAALLHIINSMEEKDLCMRLVPDREQGFESILQNRKIPPPTTHGQILYRIPKQMGLLQQHKCIVRIAFDDEDLASPNLRDDHTQKEPIRIAEVMEVQFLDQSHCNAFSIKSPSSMEQLVDRSDYTEWIFYVEPLLEGTYDLLLKVTVLEKRRDREIRKDIVLEKKIEVIAGYKYDPTPLGAEQGQPAVVAAGALLLPHAGFEATDHCLIMEGGLIPVLTPEPPPPLPPPPPPPPGILEAVLMLALIGGIIYLLWPDPLKLEGFITDNKELAVDIEGGQPPYVLSVESLGPTPKTKTKDIANPGAYTFPVAKAAFKIADHDHLHFRLLVKDVKGETTEIRRRKRFSPPPPPPPGSLSLKGHLTDDFRLLVTVEGGLPPYDLRMEQKYSDALLTGHPEIFDRPGRKEYPIDKWTRRRGERTHFYVHLELTDERGEKRDTIIEKVFREPPPIPDLTLSGEILKEGILDVQIEGGQPPYVLTLKSYGPKYQTDKMTVEAPGWKAYDIDDWKFNKTDSLFLHVRLHVKDRNGTEREGDLRRFMKLDDIPPSHDSFLSLDCSPDNERKELGIHIKGTDAPFIIYFDDKRITTLSKPKKFSESYKKAGFKHGQKVTVKVIDGNGKEKTCTSLIEMPGSKPVVVCANPIRLIPHCVEFSSENYRNDCSILYIYRKGTRDNWKMRNQTFLDRGLNWKMKHNRVRFYEMEADSILKKCPNNSFTNLGDATVFVIRSGAGTPVRLNGYTTPEKIIEHLDCRNPSLPPSPKDTIEQVINLIGRFDRDKKYEYKGELGKKGMAINEEEIDSLNCYVQLAYFKEEHNFSQFLDDLEENKELYDLKHPVFFKIEKHQGNHYFRVYIGRFQNLNSALRLEEEIEDRNLPFLLKHQIEDIWVVDFRDRKVRH